MNDYDLELVLAGLPGLGWLVQRVARAWRDATTPSADHGTVVDDAERLRWLALDGQMPPWLAHRARFRAARDGRLDVLAWALARLPPDATLCAVAARAGRIDALKVLRANGSPWGRECYHYAPLEVCHWLRGQMCPGSFSIGNEILSCTGTELHRTRLSTGPAGWSTSFEPQFVYMTPVQDRHQYTNFAISALPPPPAPPVYVQPRTPLRPPRDPVRHATPRHVARSRPTRGRSGHR